MGMMRTTGQGAFSLLELLVAGFLVSLLGAVLVRVASTVYRVGHEEMQRSAIEARVLFAAHTLKQDLAQTAPAGVSLKADGTRLIVHPVDKVLPSSRVVFEERFIHWGRPAAVAGQPQRLTRDEILSRPDGTPFDGGAYRWLPGQLAGWPPAGDQRTSLVVDGVTRFEVRNLAAVEPPQVGSLLGYTIEVELPIAQTRRAITLTGAMQTRNGGG